MSDVTINQLPDLPITGTNFLVHASSTITGRTTVNQLKTALNLANVASTGSYNDLSNRPTIPTAVSQLTNDAGYITVNHPGVARAWLYWFNGTMLGRYNIASFTRVSTGNYDVTFSTPMPNTNYCIVGEGGRNKTARGSTANAGMSHAMAITTSEPVNAPYIPFIVLKNTNTCRVCFGDGASSTDIVSCNLAVFCQ